jgi:hypothetical protein
MILLTRFFSFDDIDAEQAWALLAWCRRHGASEFTLTALVAPTESQRMKVFFAKLGVHSNARGIRRTLSAPAGLPLTREVELWQLTDQTVALLRGALSNSFASRKYDVDLWLEDFAVYRDGDFMMGVLSHENGGVLRVSELELGDLRRLGFPDRDSVPYVRY